MTRFREHTKEYLDAESMADDYLRTFMETTAFHFRLVRFRC